MSPALLPLPAPNHLLTAVKAPPNGAALAYAVQAQAVANDRLLVVVVSDSYRAQQLEQDLRALRTELPILHFPDWETLSSTNSAPIRIWYPNASTASTGCRKAPGAFWWFR